MAKEYKHEIQFEKKRPVRTKVVKVTLFDSEFKLLEDKNPYNSVAKLLRESAFSLALFLLFGYSVISCVASRYASHLPSLVM